MFHSCFLSWHELSCTVFLLSDLLAVAVDMNELMPFRTLLCILVHVPFLAMRRSFLCELCSVSSESDL